MIESVGGSGLPAAVVLDRDGTLIENIPHNARPELVRARPTAAAAVRLLRELGVATAVVSNQSVIGRGWATVEQVTATNERVTEMLGDPGRFYICPHLPTDDCDCRKPRPGLVLRAAADLGIEPAGIVVLGDRATDLGAAAAAGARGVLVVGPDTTEPEIAAAAQSAPDLLTAVRRVCGVDDR